MKPLEFTGSSREELRKLPKAVREVYSHAFFIAQNGERHVNAKPLHGFGGANVLEVIEDYQEGTYRGVYTVRFQHAAYVAQKLRSEIGS